MVEILTVIENCNLLELYIKIIVLTIIIEGITSFRVSKFITQMCGVDPFRLNELQESITYPLTLEEKLKKLYFFIPGVNVFSATHNLVSYGMTYEDFESYIKNEQEKAKNRKKNNK